MQEEQHDYSVALGNHSQNWSVPKTPAGYIYGVPLSYGFQLIVRENVERVGYTRG